jgi:hypothetical protein
MCCDVKHRQWPETDRNGNDWEHLGLHVYNIFDIDYPTIATSK